MKGEMNSQCQICDFIFDPKSDLHEHMTSVHEGGKLGQVSRMTSILEFERSLNSCMLVVQRPLAYFRSANVKTFCKYAKSIVNDVNCFVKKMGNGCNNNKSKIKSTCIAWVPKNDITFPVQLITLQYQQLLWSGKKGIFVCFVLIFAGVYWRCLVGFGQRPKFFNPSAQAFGRSLKGTSS